MKILGLIAFLIVISRSSALPSTPVQVQNCEGILCDPPTCQPGECSYLPPGACCPQCSKNNCDGDDSKKEVNPCEEIACSPPLCEAGWCHKTFPGQCCPSCSIGDCDDEVSEEIPTVGNDCQGIYCDWPQCPPDMCVYSTPGACCPGCSSRDQKCDNPDEERKAKGETVDNHCIGIFCDWPQCPPDMCVYSTPGACCPGCSSRDKCDNPKEQKNNCDEIGCSPPLCQAGECLKTVPGECCPSCSKDDCGEEVSKIPTIGNNCQGIHCDWPQCPPDMCVYSTPGACCPGCSSRDKCDNPDEERKEKGATVDDPCEGIFCDWPQCPPEMCVYSTPGSCCPGCSSRDKCDNPSEERKNCDEVTCSPPTCQEGQCLNTVEGQCCPLCTDVCPGNQGDVITCSKNRDCPRRHRCRRGECKKRRNGKGK